MRGCPAAEAHIRPHRVKCPGKGCRSLVNHGVCQRHLPHQPAGTEIAGRHRCLAPIPAPGRFSDVLRAISLRATANRSGELDAGDLGSVELIQFLKLNPACVPAIDDNIDRREQAYANPVVSDLLLHAEMKNRLLEPIPI